MKIETRTTLAGTPAEITAGAIRRWLADEGIGDDSRVSVTVDPGDARESGIVRLAVTTESGVDS